MNSIHDLGGMTCFGPVKPEQDEPVFHSDWERRVFAMNLACKAFLGPVDRVRHAIERMNPADYLRFSYYEKWLAGIEKLTKEFGYLDDEEIKKGQSKSPIELDRPAPDAEFLESIIRGGVPATRDNGRQEPAFKLGDRVRARNMNPSGHTRLPRYIRGHEGVINLFHQAHAFPDTLAHDQGENPMPLYNVCFTAEELWGSTAKTQDKLYIDLWEDYLEPVEEKK